MKKIFALLTVCLMASTMWAGTFTYDFTDASAVTTDWTISVENPKGGTGSCTASSSQFTPKSGNFLLFGFLNQSQIKITITSTASYQNISNITFDAIANDNSKPTFTLNIVDDNNTVVKNVYTDKTTKSDFNTGGTNKWGVSNSDISPATTGHIQLVLYASSSGKYAAIDNLAITYTSCSGPDFTTQPSTDGATYKVGATATALTVAASGTGVTYQWYSNTTASATGGTAISGATLASYTPSTAAAGSTYYYCEAKSSDCSVPTVSNVSGEIKVQAKSVDNSLANLTVNGAQIEGFSASKTDYSIILPAGSGQPTVVPTKNDADATITAVSITNPTANTYVATFSVTSESGATANYTINFTVDDGTPKITSFVVAGVSATIDEANHTITAELPNGTSLASLTPTIQMKNATSYSPTGAQNFSNPVVYTVGSVNYTVTLTVSELSTNANLASLVLNGVNSSQWNTAFNPNTTSYIIELASGSTTVPQVNSSATVAQDANATVQINNASSTAGNTTVVVTAQDGTTKKTYTITFKVALPPSGLSTHVPEVYEGPEIAGGYNTPLVNVGGREYEVYYVNRDQSSNASINTGNTDKGGKVITNGTGGYSFGAKDGWFTIGGKGSSSASDAVSAEFGSMIRRLDISSSDDGFEMKIQGFDQFSFVAADKKQGSTTNPEDANNRYFEVYIDGVLQPSQFSTDVTIRRYDLSTVEHLIKIIHHGTEQSKFFAFSLRVGMDPRTKHIKGNDSTQIVYQTASLTTPIYYYTKYNQTTELQWVGATGTGFDVTTLPRGAGAVGDTVYISGKANCAVGEYNYNMVAMKDGVAYSSVPGKFKVASKIIHSSGDTVPECDLGNSIAEIKYRAYVLDISQVNFSWDGGLVPAGITTELEQTANGNYFVIKGKPTSVGVYNYTLSTTDAYGTYIHHGEISVVQQDYTNSYLYLCKNKRKYKKAAQGGSNGYDRVYDYLLIDKGLNVIARTANSDAVQEASSYANYQKMVIISEDVDATSVEAIEIARGGVVNLPVLNLQGYTYNMSRLGWGYPDNGSFTNKNIEVREPSHPIFSGFGSSIAVLQNDGYEGKGLMPIEITKQNSVCLAIAPKRAYSGDASVDGDMQTIIHEVPQSDRNGQKYIAFPLSREGSSHLSATGMTLIDKIMSYLLSNTASPIVIPERQILSFMINGKAGVIDENAKTITFQLADLGDVDITAVTPEVTLKNPQKTWWEGNPDKTTTLADGTQVMNLNNSNSIGVWVKVRDYINITTYMVYVKIPTGLEDIYVDGDWMDIYDMMGRKVVTTNESLNSLDLPRGMYIIRTAKGSMKIFK